MGPAKGTAGAWGRAALISAAMLLGPALASGQAVSQPTSSPFGVATSSNAMPAHAAWMPAARAAGLRSFRGFPEWSGIEPSKGTWDFRGVDELLSNAQRNGIEVSGLLYYSPRWLGTERHVLPSANLADWSRYVRAVVGHTQGRVSHFEIWNEPNSPAFAANGSPSRYAALVRKTHEAAKAVNPEVQLGLGVADYDVNYLERTIAAGAAGKYDFIAVHPYSMLATLLEGHEAMFMNMVPNLRRMLKAQDPGNADVPIWMTEIGAKAGTFGEATQAQLALKAYVLAIAQGVERIHWYEAVDGESSYGLLRSDGSPRPAYLGLQRLIQQLGGSPAYKGWLLFNDRDYGFVFQGASTTVMALWAPPGIDNDLVRFDVPVRVLDPVTGSIVAAPAGTGVRIDNNVRLVLGVSGSWTAKALANRDKPLPWGGDFSQAGSVTYTAADPGTRAGLHHLRGQLSSSARKTADGWARDSTGTTVQQFAVDPSFLSYDSTPITVTAVVRRAGAAEAGFNLHYESTKGWKRHAAGWYKIPPGDRWHTKTWTIKDAQFNGSWGHQLRLDSDSTLHSGYLIRSLTITKADGAALEVPLPQSPAQGSSRVDPAARFAWRKVTGADRYALAVAEQASWLPQDHSESACGRCTIIATTSALSLDADGTGPATGKAAALAPGTTYHWRVRAIGKQGRASAWSAVRTFTTAPAPSDVAAAVPKPPVASPGSPPPGPPSAPSAKPSPTPPAPSPDPLPSVGEAPGPPNGSASWPYDTALVVSPFACVACSSASTPSGKPTTALLAGTDLAPVGFPPPSAQGHVVITLQRASIHGEPVPGAPSSGTQAPGTRGVTLSGPVSTVTPNGRQRRWWFVDFEHGRDGWVTEDLLGHLHGVAVHALADGVITHKLPWQAGGSGFGRVVIVRHGSREPFLHALYGHLDSHDEAPATGLPVRAGQVIGRMGHSDASSTRNAARPVQLHLQVKDRPFTAAELDGLRDTAAQPEMQGYRDPRRLTGGLSDVGITPVVVRARADGPATIYSMPVDSALPGATNPRLWRLGTLRPGQAAVATRSATVSGNTWFFVDLPSPRAAAADDELRVAAHGGWVRAVESTIDRSTRIRRVAPAAPSRPPAKLQQRPDSAASALAWLAAGARVAASGTELTQPDPQCQGQVWTPVDMPDSALEPSPVTQGWVCNDALRP